MPEGPPRKKAPLWRTVGTALGYAAALGGAYKAEKIWNAEQVGSTVSHSFNERERAATQLAERGITDYQRGVYREGNELLARGYYPFAYVGKNLDITEPLYQSALGLVFNMNELREADCEKDVAQAVTPTEKAVALHRLRVFRSRMDAWRMYLGLPQQHDTFTISKFKPEQGVEDTYYYSLREFSPETLESMRPYLSDEFKNMAFIPLLLTLIEKNKGTKADRAVVTDHFTRVMGQFTLSKGTEVGSDGKTRHFISYYDRWNLEGSKEGEEGWRGKPYDIYDRFYYDPVTLQIIEPPTAQEPIT